MDFMAAIETELEHKIQCNKKFVHAFNPALRRERKVNHLSLRTACRMSSRLAKATKRNPCVLILLKLRGI